MAESYPIILTFQDWVTNKLKELEEQNRHLREQNAHCNDQMDLLKGRLEQLQEMANTRKSNSRSGSRSSSVIMEVGAGIFYDIMQFS